ncbi:hypothetical protein I6F48_21105 [Pseudoalteromonas sp. SWYJ118]|uniref:hypothetical protein n=1 Tax=Pseudoalteromonas sp. SWYJ118 TaxID=2792062 RepID=UPI0018CCFCAA|nr:hypothetical protein [Pseudoalteromonas sp. SWYJ118]MBH0077986.1 hypothetical protein [Pseudoalteromonas sp. SWYJ118]
MKKQYLSFDVLDESDKDFFINDSWCDYCEKADLGIIDPKIYILDEKQHLEGVCKICGHKQITEVIFTEIKG